jgi:hypothetical protein
MPELILNLHMHTIYSDGTGTHRALADAAIGAGVDVLLTSDHNVLVQDVDGYYTGSHKQDNPTRRVLLLAGEEIHDPLRQPQKSHLLVFGAGREMAQFAGKPQHLLDQVQKAGGLSFIAHPHDQALKAFNEPDISWDNWDVHGYTGIELWNGFSELKNVVRGRVDALFYAFFPRYMARGPLPATLNKWDDLLRTDRKVVAVGGSDAHALKMRMGPLRRTIFPYSYHFHAVNTHLLVENELGNNLADDRTMVYSALRSGSAFIGYDLPAPTTGFRFTAQGRSGTVSMGEEIRMEGGVTFQIRLPMKAECRLIHNGETVKTWRDREICTYISAQPGVFRVECSIDYLGRKRGWIYSNPIYVKG